MPARTGLLLTPFSPAAASGASSLLGSTGFIGFSDVLPTGAAGSALLGLSGGGEAASLPSAAVSATPFYAGDDSDLNVICKRLGKKDRCVTHPHT